MKLTKSQLKRIIKENINTVLLEDYGNSYYSSSQKESNQPNNQLLATFIQESNALRKSISDFQETQRKFRADSQHIENVTDYISNLVNN